METRVRFVEGGQKTYTVLEITTPARHPLTESLDRRLKRLGVQVVHSENRESRNKVSLVLHLSEFDGTPLSQRRRLELQTLLLANASPSSTPPPVDAKPRPQGSGQVREEHID
jgi:hypothetical protein